MNSGLEGVLKEAVKKAIVVHEPVLRVCWAEKNHKEPHSRMAGIRDSTQTKDRSTVTFGVRMTRLNSVLSRIRKLCWAIHCYRAQVVE
jgi:hypothetical protein